MLGVILMAVTINAGMGRLQSNLLTSLDCISVYITQNVNIATSRNVQLTIKLPNNINGVLYEVKIHSKEITVESLGLKASKQSSFPMEETILSAGKCYRITQNQQLIRFTEVSG